MEDEYLLRMYKEKYIAALLEIEQLKKRLTYYTDQSWELETLRQQSYEKDNHGWK